MIEFDVQLSKDMVPVIYHDFYVCTAMMKKATKQSGDGELATDMLHLPVKELTLAQVRNSKTINLPVKGALMFYWLIQLQKLRIYHVKESSRVPKLEDDDFEDHQPFPTLQHALEHVDPHVGFNVEIKWTMQLKVCFIRLQDDNLTDFFI